MKAVKVVDECVGRLWQAAQAQRMAMLVTADHGNCELMTDPLTGQPHTAHTLNPVPVHPRRPGLPRREAPREGRARRRRAHRAAGDGAPAAEGDEGARAPPAMTPQGSAAPGGPLPPRPPRCAAWPAALLEPRLPAALRRVRRAASPRSRSARSAGTRSIRSRRAARAAACPAPSRSAAPAAPIRPRSTRVRAGGLFGGPLADAIHAFKYGGRPALARPLGAWLARAAPLPPGALVVSVPLSRGRRIERGYDQAALLADALARAAGARDRGSAARSGARARRRRRWADARGAQPERRGRVRGGPAAEIAGRDVVLVDDVVTTGATVDAAARALRQAGARTVVVVALARAE